MSRTNTARQSNHSQVHDDVRNYYGEVLKSNRDLKTSACCTADSLPEYLRAVLPELHPEVREKFYGCGSPIPLALAGRTVLDLGCGSGRDSYLLSKLVGQEGTVIGVDMTDTQLEVARRHLAYHASRFGHAKSNVRFLNGYIEDLASLGLSSESVDVIVSNCVINLSPDKARVFAETFRVLKPGGELYFSDIFADRRIPESLRSDPVLLGECLGGAMYFEDFRRLMTQTGCADVRVVNRSPITVTDPNILKQTGLINFESVTVRAFKLPLEDRCEDYGQVAYYQGTLPEAPHSFRLDDHHLFEKGRPVPVCGNTADMLKQTRFAGHFDVVGEKSVHFGLFDCAAPDSRAKGAQITGGSCC